MIKYHAVVDGMVIVREVGTVHGNSQLVSAVPVVQMNVVAMVLAMLDFRH